MKQTSISSWHFFIFASLILVIVIGGTAFGEWNPYSGSYEFDTYDYVTSPKWTTTPSTGSRTGSTGTTGTTTAPTGSTTSTTTACATPNRPTMNPQGTRTVEIRDYNGKVFYASPPKEEVTGVRAYPESSANIVQIISDGSGKQIDEKIIGTITVDNKCYPKYGHITPPGSPPPPPPAPAALTEQTAPDDSTCTENSNPGDTTLVRVDASTGEVFHKSSGVKIPDARFDRAKFQILFKDTSSIYGKMLSKTCGYVNIKNFTPVGGFPTTGCKNNAGQILNNDPNDTDFRKVKLMDAAGTLTYHPEKPGESEGPVDSRIKTDFTEKILYVPQMINGAEVKKQVGSFIYDDASCYPQFGYIIPSYVAKYTTAAGEKTQEKPVETELTPDGTKTKPEQQRPDMPKTAPKVFQDVAADAVYAQAVSHSLANGWIPAKKKFNPGKKMTRCDFAVISIKAAGAPLETGYAGEFNDITQESEYAPYALTAFKLGILEPRKKTPSEFSCKKAITRGETEAAFAWAKGEKPAPLAKNEAKQKPTKAEIIQMLFEAFGGK